MERFPNMLDLLPASIWEENTEVFWKMEAHLENLESDLFLLPFEPV